MRIGFVVQRYGDSFVGGAEKYVLSMATGLAAEGHDVAVVTSCATSYDDWADVYTAGTTVEHGVTVHRLPVVAPWDNKRFAPLHQRAIQVRDIPLWPWGQDRWSELIGPDLADPNHHLIDLASASDATFVVGYHYSQTLRFTKILAAHGPTVVVPTAHPEGAFHVGYVRQMFDHADRILCLAPEEADLVSGVYGHDDRIRCVPCPVDPVDPPGEDAIESVVERYDLGRDRYAVVVGRIDPGKGSDDLIRFTGWYRQSLDPSFELVVIGPGESTVADGVHLTGFVDESSKNALIAGSGLLIQPSYMESFSFALIEGWLFDRPALVQERSRVLAGHVARSGGGLVYHDYFSFEAALATMREEHSMAADLGRRGGRYARNEYSWDSVRDRFLSVVEELV